MFKQLYEKTITLAGHKSSKFFLGIIAVYFNQLKVPEKFYSKSILLSLLIIANTSYCKFPTKIYFTEL